MKLYLSVADTPFYQVSLTSNLEKRWQIKHVDLPFQIEHPVHSEQASASMLKDPVSKTTSFRDVLHVTLTVSGTHNDTTLFKTPKTMTGMAQIDIKAPQA